MIQIYPSKQLIATTTDGKVFMRVGDECVPIKGEELTRLAHEKGSFQWELVLKKTTLSETEPKNIQKFVHEIRTSTRVSDFIKEQSVEDILEYYRLVEDGGLTNLGILWLDTFKAMNLMESEGSGYDLIYEKLSLDGKRFPVIESDINYVNVTIYSNIMDSEVLQILDFLAQYYQLNQKEIIAVGVVAREKRILGYDLSQILQLKDDDRLRNWVGNLIKKEILITEGKTKGLMYMLNPKILASMEHSLKPSLKTMEEPHLRALIIEDLKIHPKSKISEIYGRMGDLELKYLRRVVYRMVDEGLLDREGIRSNMVYFIAK